MTLNEWFRLQGDSAQHELAQRCNCSQSAISRFVSGERMPSPSLMQAIYRHTAGQVEPNDFYRLPKLSNAVRRARDVEKLATLAERVLPKILSAKVLTALRPDLENGKAAA